MISVGGSGRDARQELGLGFGSRRSEMDDTELEEGEACFYQNNDDYDASIDPDVALSYIDEKLQDVLGHFQKDFEGGVSAENLGAKFGGYGSFLPTHQRSPVWSQRTPPKVQSYSASRSPNNFNLEGGHCNSVVSSTAPLSGGRGPASTSSTSLPAVKASSVNGLGKQEASMPAAHVEEVAPRLDFKNKKPSSASDQKTLKVRIKVGSDNLSTRKNAAIYSGLGLDDSPSSSLDDSPSESEGISHEHQDAPFESPTSILQIMTSFPVQGGLLLSPLHDDLVHLMEKEKLPKEVRYVPVPRGGVETSALINGSDTMKSDGKMLGEKNMKLIEKNDCSAESKSGSDKDARLRDLSRKEPDLDALACEELVSKTLKLPILSNLDSTASDMKRSRDINKSVLKDKVFSNQVEEEPMESTFAQEDGWVEKRKASSTGKGLVEGKEISINDISVHPRKEGQQKGEKICDTVKSDSNVMKAKKALNTESMDPSKQKANKKVLSHDQENTRLPHGKDSPFPGEKKKLKGSHGTISGEVPKESLRVGSSVRKSKKSTNMDISTPNTDAEHGKSRKDLGKPTDRYKDFFGELDEEDNPIGLSEIPSEDKQRESDVRAKSVSVINGTPKEQPSGKKIEKPSTSEAVPLPGSSPRSGNGLLSDAAQPAAAPVLIEENWVQCDKCQKWRLLPLGTNPDHLPEKWLCSMLKWLPGMNRCSFTEEETTKSLIALYQPTAPESQTNLHSNPVGIFSGATLTNFRHPEQNLRNHNGKKKHGLKVMSTAANKDSPTRLSNMKKSMQASARSRSLNDVNNSPLVNEPDFQQLSKSIDFTVENKHKYKEKNKVVDPHAFGGVTKNSKVKSRRDSDQDSSRASKKIKTEVKNITDEDWTSDHSGAVGKVGPSSSSGFPTSSAGKDRTKYSDRSFSKDSKFDSKDKLQASISKSKVKDEVSLDNGSLERGNTETRDNVKKRKTKELQNGSYPSREHLPNSMPFVKEEFSDNDYRKEKKPKISRSEGKESSASKGSSRADKKRSHSKNQLHARDLGIVNQHNLDGSLAATSSSSKVSGSHKTKSSFQEVKGSPVESVSSSPLRIANPEKFTSAGRDVSTKDEFQHLGNFAICSPKRSSEGEDLGRGDRAGRKENMSYVASHGYLESSGQDFLEKDFKQASSGKTRRQAVSSPDIANHHSMNGALDNSGQDTQYPMKALASDHFGDEEKQNGFNYHANGSRPRKSTKGSSSRLDKNRSFKSDFDAVQVKSSDVGELHDQSPSDDLKPKDSKQKLHEKLGVKSEEIEEKVSSRKDGTGKMLSESCKRENQLNVGGPDGIDQKDDAICRKDTMSTPMQIFFPVSNDERSSKRLVAAKTDQVEAVSSGERSVLLPPSGGPQSDVLIRCSQPGTGSHKGNGADTLQVDACEGDNALKVQKHIRKVDSQSRSQQISSRHPTKNGHRARDAEAPSPIRKDLSSHAATNALKEAKDLKHMADRLKSSGSNHERTGLYFQAALKFLHGASLLESGCSENSNHNDTVRSRQTYSETAKLCEFCAHEYEKSKDMAAAALAYKCMEVAYMRVIYSSHTSASRDRHDLQTALQVVPLGESPSSSASDVDNLNNHTTADKIALPKGVSSPQIAANHVIAARNRPNFVRLLNFAQDVNFAMEASRKSRIAFAAANVNMAEAKYGESISSIKRALDFNFQDVDGLLRLVRLAMEAISR